MAEMLAQLFYRLMRDHGVTVEDMLVHIGECSPSVPAQFSNKILGVVATEFAKDFERIAVREAA